MRAILIAFEMHAHRHACFIHGRYIARKPEERRQQPHRPRAHHIHLTLHRDLIISIRANGVMFLHHGWELIPIGAEYGFEDGIIHGAGISETGIFVFTFVGNFSFRKSLTQKDAARMIKPRTNKNILYDKKLREPPSHRNERKRDDEKKLFVFIVEIIIPAKNTNTKISHDSHSNPFMPEYRYAPPMMNKHRAVKTIKIFLSDIIILASPPSDKTQSQAR